MKRIGLLVLSVALAGVGCLPTSFLRHDQKPPSVEMKEASPPEPVMPEDVTEKNAAERALQLREELDYDENQPAPAEQPKSAAAK
jgi:hypothetical protein